MVDVVWWIGDTDSEVDANVSIKHEMYSGVTVPVLVNTKPIKKHSLLLVFKAKPAPVALEGAVQSRKRKRA